jgi:hypothetical protein
MALSGELHAIVALLPKPQKERRWVVSEPVRKLWREEISLP